MLSHGTYFINIWQFYGTQPLFFPVITHVQNIYIYMMTFPKMWSLLIMSQAISRFVIGGLSLLTHWGWVTHSCIGNLTIIGSDKGWSAGWYQAIIWTDAGIWLIRLLGTHFIEFLWRFFIQKMYLEALSAKGQPFYLGPNMLRPVVQWKR